MRNINYKGGIELKHKFRLQLLTGIIHNLDGGCKNGKYIKECNRKDFYTYDEAVIEAGNRGKEAHKCQKCKW